MSRYLAVYFALTLIHLEGGRNAAFGTIDVNLSELEYLASHLKPSECRRLAAALHYNSYDLPEDLDEATRKLGKDIGCLELLVHWNSAESEGRGATHEQLGHRLRQLGHAKLADWLGKTTFNELGKDLLESLDRPIADEVSTVPTISLPSTTRPRDEAYLGAAQDATTIEQTETRPTGSSGARSGKIQDWLTVDMIVILSSALLLFMLTVVCGICLIGRLARCESEESLCETGDESEKLLDK